MAIRVDGWFRQAEEGNFLRQIHLALHNRHIIKFNLERFLCPNAPDHFGRSPLILAILTCAGLRELKVLIYFGADVNGLWVTKYPYGRISPLGIAVRFRDLEMVKFLLQNGADPNLRLFEGNTALHLAVICEELPIVDALLENEADPHAKNKYGYTPLHLAAIGSNPLLKRILKSSDSPVHCGPDGETPLHIAAQANNMENVKLLVNKLGHVNFEMQGRLMPYECAPKHSKVRQFLSEFDLGSSSQRKTEWKPFSKYFPEPLIKLMEAIKPILLQALLDEDSIVKELLPKDKTSSAESCAIPTTEFCPPIKIEPQWYWIPYATDFPNPCITQITSGFSLPTLAVDYVHTTYDKVFEKLKNGEIMDKKDYFLCFMTVVKCWGAFSNSYEALALGGTCLKMLKNVGENT